MKHLNAEKYNLAWFKLAECVSRGEKERALGVYRLLSHSVGSDALTKQLFGDLLLCFEDKEGAIQKYKESAVIYKKQGKYIESIAVYEHLLVLNGDDKDDIFDLCELYKTIEMLFKIVYHVHNLTKNNKLDFAIKLIKKYDELFDFTDSLVLHQELALALVKDKTSSQEAVTTQLNRTLDKFLDTSDQHLLSDFLLKLEIEDEGYYQHACEYLKKA